MRRRTTLGALIAVAVACWAGALIPQRGLPVSLAGATTLLIGLDVLALRATAPGRRARARQRSSAGSAPMRGAVESARTQRSLPAQVQQAQSNRISATSKLQQAPLQQPPCVPPMSALAVDEPDRDASPGDSCSDEEGETGEVVGVERPNPLMSEDRWIPVPLPLPTYLLKPAVSRPRPQSWAGENGPAKDLDLDAVLARRRAVG